MASLIVRVGAVADRSVTDVWTPLVTSGRKAKAQAAAEAKASAQAVAQAAKQRAAAETRANEIGLRSHTRMNEIVLRNHLAREREMERQTERRANAQARQAERAARVEQAAIDGVARQRRKQAEAEEKTRQKRAMDVGSGAMRTLGGVARAGVGVARDVAAGAGVNFDLGSIIGGGVDMQAKAVQLSNSAFRGAPGEKRIDPRQIVEQARAVGDKYGFDPSKVIEGLGRFQETTGDLATGNAGLDNFTRLAKSTGTALDDMIASAGEVSVALGDAFATPQDKAKAIYETLKVLGSQGQEGAVEFRSLATQMPKLAAAASSFEGDKAKNLQSMGALVQLAKQMGGAPSATSAATSISGFSNILKTPARLKQFDEAGINVWSDTQKGKLKDPIAILRESIEKRGNDPIGLKKLFANVVGAKPAEALATIYRDAGGGEAGIKAFDAAIKKFSGKMSEEKITGDVAAAMDTTASKVQLFNNEMSRVGEELAGQILPKLSQASPAIIRFLSVMAENPGKAAAAAIAAGIGKAALGDIASTALQTAIKNNASAVGSAGLVFGTATLTIAAATIVAEYLNTKKAAGAKETEEQIAFNAESLRGIEQRAKDGTLSPEDVENLKRMKAEGSQSLERAKESDYGRVGPGVIGDITKGITTASLLMFTGKTAESVGADDAAARNERTVLSDTKAIDALLSQLTNGVLKVEVTNQPTTPGAAPGVDNSGRQ